MLLNEVMLETFQGNILCDINFVPEPAEHQGSIPAPCPADCKIYTLLCGLMSKTHSIPSNNYSFILPSYYIK